MRRRLCLSRAGAHPMAHENGRLAESVEDPGHGCKGVQRCALRQAPRRSSVSQDSLQVARYFRNSSPCAGAHPWRMKIIGSRCRDRRRSRNRLSAAEPQSRYAAALATADCDCDTDSRPRFRPRWIEVAGDFRDRHDDAILISNLQREHPVILDRDGAELFEIAAHHVHGVVVPLELPSRQKPTVLC
jgi:hypothetical protein